MQNSKFHRFGFELSVSKFCQHTTRENEHLSKPTSKTNKFAILYLNFLALESAISSRKCIVCAYSRWSTLNRYKSNELCCRKCDAQRWFLEGQVSPMFSKRSKLIYSYVPFYKIFVVACDVLLCLKFRVTAYGMVNGYDLYVIFLNQSYFTKLHERVSNCSQIMDTCFVETSGKYSSILFIVSTSRLAGYNRKKDEKIVKYHSMNSSIF